MDSGLDEWLGKIFGQLTEIISQLGDVAKSLEYIVKQVGKFKKVLDDVSGGNGGGILLLLSLMLFRFKALRKAVGFATRSFARNGSAMRALMHLMRGAFGQTIVGLIKRFGGWIAVIYGAYKALGYLGRQLKERDLGNWTIFDTISIMAKSAMLKVKILIAELKWLQAFMTSGAMMDSSFEDIKKGISNRLSSFGGAVKDRLDSTFESSTYGTGNRMGQEWRKFLFGVEKRASANTPITNQPSYRSNNTGVYLSIVARRNFLILLVKIRVVRICSRLNKRDYRPVFKYIYNLISGCNMRIPTCFSRSSEVLPIPNNFFILIEKRVA